MPLRSLLLGSKLKVAATAFTLVVAGLGGALALGVVGAPSVVAVQNQFGPVSEETTIIETDIVVNNPNPIGIRLGDTTVNYTVKMNDVEMAHGSKTGLEIDPGNTTLNFTTEMENDRIPPWWVSHIRNDEVTNVTVDATIETGLLGNRTFDIKQEKQVKTDIIAQFNSDETRPVNGPSSPIYDNPVLYINETSAEWGTVSKQKTPIDMAFTVYNPQLKPYTITEVGYTITMNGVNVGQGATKQPYVIKPRSTTVVRTTPVIRNGKLDDWWVTHLENEQVTQLRIDFYAKVELPTGNTIRIPLNELTYEKTIETDIFGTKADGTSSTQSEATPTPTPTPTPGGVSTPTPISTPTGTPLPDGVTPTATPTPILGIAPIVF